VAVVAGLLTGCASFVPLRDPPALDAPDPAAAVTTRAEAVSRLGPPAEVRASDLGEVLVYRRRVVADRNPARYYGEDRGETFDRYERVLLYLDGSGRVVRRVTEPE
jgi:hypothetical protein